MEAALRQIGYAAAADADIDTIECKLAELGLPGAYDPLKWTDICPGELGLYAECNTIGFDDFCGWLRISSKIVGECVRQGLANSNHVACLEEARMAFRAAMFNAEVRDRLVDVLKTDVWPEFQLHRLGREYDTVPPAYEFVIILLGTVDAKLLVQQLAEQVRDSEYSRAKQCDPREPPNQKVIYSIGRVFRALRGEQQILNRHNAEGFVQPRQLALR